MVVYGGNDMVLVIICLLFLFIGMYIGNKFDLKKISINMIFGLFLINLIFGFLSSSSVLSRNYHSSTWFYLILGIIVGYILMMIMGEKYDETDNISIGGFTLLNTFILVMSRFNLLSFIFNILYYVFIGIYIRKSKSWISVLIGMVFGLLFSSITSWILGYIFTIALGFIIYFIVSVYSIVFKSNDKKAYYSLIAGMVIALLGGLL